MVTICRPRYLFLFIDEAGGENWPDFKKSVTLPQIFKNRAGFHTLARFLCQFDQIGPIIQYV